MCKATYAFLLENDLILPRKSWARKYIWKSLGELQLKPLAIAKIQLSDILTTVTFFSKRVIYQLKNELVLTSWQSRSSLMKADIPMILPEKMNTSDKSDQPIDSMIITTTPEWNLDESIQMPLSYGETLELERLLQSPFFDGHISLQLEAPVLLGSMDMTQDSTKW